MPSAALGKVFAECKLGFAECPWHSAKPLIPVVKGLHEKIEALLNWPLQPTGFEAAWKETIEAYGIENDLAIQTF